MPGFTALYLSKVDQWVIYIMHGQQIICNVLETHIYVNEPNINLKNIAYF